MLFAGGVFVFLLAAPSVTFGANLVLHYSADDVLGNGGLVKPSDNDLVPVWHDLAGVNNATIGLINPLNPTNPPYYRDGVTGTAGSGTSLTLNGHPTVEFGFNYGASHTGLDSTFLGGKNNLPAMTVVWVGAGDVVNDYHPFWTFDASTGGHHRSAAMWAGLPQFAGTPVTPLQYDPCCGTAIFLKHNDGLDVDGGGVRTEMAAIAPPLNGDATWHVFAARFNFPGKFDVVVDGTVKQSPANESIPSPDAAQMLALGYLPAGGGNGNNLRMLLSDFQIYDGYVTDADMNQLGSSLASKYGLSWSPIVPEPCGTLLLVLGVGAQVFILRRRS